MSTFGLLPVNIVTPTHFTNSSETLIDILYTNALKRILLYDQLSMPSFSRRDLIFLTFDFCFTNNDAVHDISFRDFKNVDYGKLSNDVNQIDWHHVRNLTSSEDQMQFLQANIVRLFETHVPIKTQTRRVYDNRWFNAEIKKEIDKRNKMYDHWKRYKTHDFLGQFLALRKSVSIMIRNAKAKYFENSFARAIGSKQTRRKIKTIGLVSSKTKHPPDLEDLDSINEKFTNISAPLVTNTYIDVPCSVPNDLSFSFSCIDQSDALECFLSVKSNALAQMVYSLFS